MKYILAFLFLLQIQHIQAQEMRARVLNAQTKEPIAFASVILSENRGLVTNEEGWFQYYFEKGTKPDTVTISFMGFENLKVLPQALDGGNVFLKPSSIELREVFISDENLSAKEIFERASEKIAVNYIFDTFKRRIFLRETYSNYVHNFKMEVDKSTIEGIDQNLMDEIAAKMPKAAHSYREVLADSYGNYDTQNTSLLKAAYLYNPQSTASLEELTNELQSLFRSNVKDNSYLKIRSGWVGVKVKEDELRENLDILDNQREKSAEEKKKDSIAQRKWIVQWANNKVADVFTNIFWKKGDDFNLFEKPNRYQYTLLGHTFIENEAAYIIEFEPKRNADFKGKLYINALDFGVHRLEYENVKALKKFKLLGISTAHDVYRGKVFFVKNDGGKYQLSYLENENGKTVGVKRPLTIIEKNKHVKGRRKQNELDFDLNLKMSQVEKIQLLVFDHKLISAKEVKSLPKNDIFEYKTFKSYHPEFWEGYNIIEPNAAIKKFTVEN